MTPEARRLETLLHARGRDGLLEMLAEFARGPASIGVPINILVGGTLIRGALGASIPMAEEMDAKIARSLESAHVSTVDVDETAAAKTRERLARAFAEAAPLGTVAKDREDNYQKSRKIAEQYYATLPDDFRPTIDDIPSESFAEITAAQAPTNFLTISNGQVLLPTGWQEAGYLRIRVDQIGAWWLGL